MSDRTEAMQAFLKSAGWGGATITPLAGDASTRRYFRVALNGRKAMLMDQPPHAETPVAPADATPEQRQKLGYIAVARLAGADVGRFVAVANYLHSHGLTAPQIYAADIPNGYALIEDLGDDLFDSVLLNGGDERELYLTAADVLAKLHESEAPKMLDAKTPLLSYDETAQLGEVDLMTEWFMPMALGRAATDDEVQEHRALWKAALDTTRTLPPVLIHRDYHAQNLLWLPQKKDHARVGILDFQDAVSGSRAQDLMHLVQDARRDVSTDVTDATIRRYLDASHERGMALDKEQFGAEMAIISGQRLARIVGVFGRLYKRDNKPRYLEYLPRVWGHLNKDLSHPALSGLKRWYDRAIPMEKRGKPQGVSV
ncbi:MAG: aminoglycoside phosphotransferase family protein [Rhizomicrobium sp.]